MIAFFLSNGLQPDPDLYDLATILDPSILSACHWLVASIPILFIFWALIIRKMKGYQASLIATAIALIIALTVYGMPVKLALLSVSHGALYGLFPICWLVIMAFSV